MNKEMKLDHINIKVPDLKKAIEFYTNVMGFEVKDRYSNGEMDFVFVTDGNTVYELLEDKALEQSVFDHIAYESKDIKKDYQYYKSINSELILTDINYIDFLFENGVYYFFIKGSGNEKIEFCERKKG